jgi:hypothetical protein
MYVIVYSRFTDTSFSWFGCKTFQFCSWTEKNMHLWNYMRSPLVCPLSHILCVLDPTIFISLENFEIYPFEQIINQNFYIHIHYVFLETPFLHIRRLTYLPQCSVSFHTGYVAASTRKANPITWMKQKQSIIRSTIARWFFPYIISFSCVLSHFPPRKGCFRDANKDTEVVVYPSTSGRELLHWYSRFFMRTSCHRRGAQWYKLLYSAISCIPVEDA